MACWARVRAAFLHSDLDQPVFPSCSARFLVIRSDDDANARKGDLDTPAKTAKTYALRSALHQFVVAMTVFERGASFCPNGRPLATTPARRAPGLKLLREGFTSLAVSEVAD